MANWPDTVTVESEAVLEAVSALRAVEQFLVVLNGRVDSHVGELISQWGSALKHDAFGDEPEGDKEYESDPLQVEIWAREQEKCADLLHSLMGTRELTVPLSAHELWGEELDARKSAEEMREAGSINPEKAVTA
jgi:hypothetical protein